MPNFLCLKRRIGSCTKKAILDSSSSDDESSLEVSRIARKPIKKSPVNSTSRAVRIQPASIAKKKPENITFTIDSQFSSDDDDSLLKPMVVTNRRRVTNSPSFLSRNVKCPPPSKDNSRAADDSSVDTEELKSRLIDSPRFLSRQVELSRPLKDNSRAADDSSVDTEELNSRLIDSPRFLPRQVELSRPSKDNSRAADDSSVDTEELKSRLIDSPRFLSRQVELSRPLKDNSRAADDSSVDTEELKSLLIDSPRLLSRNVKCPPPSKDNSRAADDSSVDTAELKLLLLKPTPKSSSLCLDKDLPPKTPLRHTSPQSQNSQNRVNFQRSDDSSEDTKELTRVLLDKNYSPPEKTRGQESGHPTVFSIPPASDGKFPTEINTIASSVNPAPEGFDIDEFELPDQEESSDSSVASQMSENTQDQKLPAQTQQRHGNHYGQKQIPNNVYLNAGSVSGAAASNQARHAHIAETRNHLDSSVYHTDNTGRFDANGRSASGKPNHTQKRKGPPNPAQLRLRDLREAAFFDASTIDLSHSEFSDSSPKRVKYSSQHAFESTEPQANSNHSDQYAQLERAAFFSDSHCNHQAESPSAQVRMGLHSPRVTPISRVPSVRAAEQVREDFIQEFSDEETAVQRFGRLASHALEQKRHNLLQTAQSQHARGETGLSNNHGGPPRRLRDPAASRAVVLRQAEEGHYFNGGLAQRNDVTGGSGAGLAAFAFAPAPRERDRATGQGRGNGTGANKKRLGGWKGRGKWGKNKGKKKGGAGGRGRGSGRDNTGFSARQPSSSGAFSRGDDANLRHIGGAEFSF